MTTRTEGLRAVLWTRVSSHEQTTENQLLKLREAADERGYRVVSHIDLPGVSAYRQEAKKYTRAINKLYDMAESGAFDVVLVTALDRMTRKGGDRLRTIIQTLDDNAVSVISLLEKFTEHQTARMDRFARNRLIELVGSMAEYESVKISERTLAGQKIARQKGVVFGRPVVWAGVDVELVLALRAEGLSWRKVHKAHPETRNAKGKKVKPSMGTIRNAIAVSGAPARGY